MELTKNDSIKNNLRVPRVLIIEDHLQTAEIMGALMNMSGYACHLTRDASDTFKLLAEYQPDLIILDYILPIGNGGELCSRIKSDPCFCHLPVMIYSAYPKGMLSLENYRCDKFIAKPFDLEQMVIAIDEMLAPKLFARGRLHRNYNNNFCA